MTTDDKYSRRNVLNLTQQVEAQSSQKQKSFSGFFLAFLKCALNLEHFEKQDEYPSLIISKVIDFERGGYINVKKGFSSEHHSVVNLLTASKHC